MPCVIQLNGTLAEFEFEILRGIGMADRRATSWDNELPALLFWFVMIILLVLLCLIRPEEDLMMEQKGLKLFSLSRINIKYKYSVVPLTGSNNTSCWKHKCILQYICYLNNGCCHNETYKYFNIYESGLKLCFNTFYVISDKK